jgi:hypothetical protein
MENDDDDESAKWDRFLVYVGCLGTHTGWMGGDFTLHPIGKFIFDCTLNHQTRRLGVHPDSLNPDLVSSYWHNAGKEYDDLDIIKFDTVRIPEIALFFKNFLKTKHNNT